MAGAGAVHPVTVTIDGAHPGPEPGSGFAGLSFERGPLSPGNAGVPGYLFSPGNKSLIGLFRHMGLGSLRIGGGSVDQQIPAGTGRDGFAGIDNLFAFAAEAGVKVIYTLRLLSHGPGPAGDLKAIHTGAARYIWDHYREQLDSIALGNEPDWHAYHTYPGHQLDPAIYEHDPGVPGSAYQSYLARWQDMAAAIAQAAPGIPFSGPDTGAYSADTYCPGPGGGMSWTERFARDERDLGRIAQLTQHYYVGGDPGQTTASQAIGNMLSAEWADPWLYEHNLAPVVAAGLRYRLTEFNDYLVGVPGASDAYPAALWALDHLHWWAAHGADGVNFHNKQWLYTATIVPGPGRQGYAVRPKGYGIKAFTLGSAGQVKPVRVDNPGGISLTAYCAGTGREDCVTVINKTHGAGAADAEVTIIPGGPGGQFVTLAGGQPAGGSAWNGQWSPLPAGTRSGVSLTVEATTAAVVKIPRTS